MALLAHLQLLDQHPHLQHIKTLQLLDFLRLASLLKRDIDLAQPARLDLEAAPEFLPHSVAQFLSNATGLSIEDVMVLWSVFKDEAWQLDSDAHRSSMEETAFKTHGWHLGISASYSAFF